jgi:hypothetical protein
MRPLAIIAFIAIANTAAAQHCRITGTCQGSGTVIGNRDGKTYVLTAAQVLARDKDLTVEVYAGNRLVGFFHKQARLAAKDIVTDLALLEIASQPMPFLPVGKKQRGKGVLWGCPKGVQPMSRLCGMDSEGIINLTAVGGASGGAYVEGNTVCGVTIHVQGGRPLKTIRAFLAKEHAWLNKLKYEAIVIRPRIGGTWQNVLRQWNAMSPEQQNQLLDELFDKLNP